MEYYRIYFNNNKIDYAYTINQLIDIIENNDVKRIEFCKDNTILNSYKSLNEVLKGDVI